MPKAALKHTDSSSSPVRRVDVAVIGGGTAGLRAYRAAKAEGASAVLIDPGPLGTTCARVGCMPSKLLIAAADAAHHAREAWRFGADAQREPTVDGRAVMRRVRAERDRFVGFVLAGMDDVPAADRVPHRATFTGPNRVQAGPDVIEAGAFVLATGSRPRTFPMFDGLGDALIDNEGLFALDTLPTSVAVFGAGVIGLELGQALARLGVRTHVYGVGGGMGPLSDPALIRAARVALADEPHLGLSPDAHVSRLTRTADGRVHIESDATDGAPAAATYDKVLLAVGRVSNVDKLGISAVDPAAEAQARQPADTLRIGETALFVAGDALPTRPLLHEAVLEGTAAGQNAVRHARGEVLVPLVRQSALGVVFTAPGLAMVGESHRELTARGVQFVTGAVDFGDQGRSRVMLQNAGRLHVYAEAHTGRFLGAEMVAPRAEHLAHLLAWAHQNEMTVEAMAAMPFYHPVIEEGVRTALRDATSSVKRASEGSSVATVQRHAA